MIIDPELEKQINDALKGPEIEKKDITPSSKSAEKIMSKLERLPTSMLCIMHTFITEQLHIRGIQVLEEDDEDNNKN